MFTVEESKKKNKVQTQFYEKNAKHDFYAHHVSFREGYQVFW